MALQSPPTLTELHSIQRSPERVCQLIAGLCTTVLESAHELGEIDIFSKRLALVLAQAAAFAPHPFQNPNPKTKWDDVDRYLQLTNSCKEAHFTYADLDHAWHSLRNRLFDRRGNPLLTRSDVIQIVNLIVTKKPATIPEYSLTYMQELFESFSEANNSCIPELQSAMNKLYGLCRAVDAEYLENTFIEYLVSGKMVYYQCVQHLIGVLINDYEGQSIIQMQYMEITEALDKVWNYLKDPDDYMIFHPKQIEESIVYATEWTKKYNALKESGV